MAYGALYFVLCRFYYVDVSAPALNFRAARSPATNVSTTDAQERVNTTRERSRGVDSESSPAKSLMDVRFSNLETSFLDFYLEQHLLELIYNCAL